MSILPTLRFLSQTDVSKNDEAPRPDATTRATRTTTLDMCPPLLPLSSPLTPNPPTLPAEPPTPPPSYEANRLSCNALPSPILSPSPLLSFPHSHTSTRCLFLSTKNTSVACLDFLSSFYHISRSLPFSYFPFLFPPLLVLPRKINSWFVLCLPSFLVCFCFVFITITCLPPVSDLWSDNFLCLF